jgi:hypothetical protein
MLTISHRLNLCRPDGAFKYGICDYPTNILPLRGNNTCHRHGILVEMKISKSIESPVGTKYLEYVKAD